MWLDHQASYVWCWQIEALGRLTSWLFILIEVLSKIKNFQGFLAKDWWLDEQKNWEKKMQTVILVWTDTKIIVEDSWQKWISKLGV